MMKRKPIRTQTSLGEDLMGDDMIFAKKEDEEEELNKMLQIE